MSYKISKEDLIKIEKFKNLSNSQLKFISSINSQISFIDVGTLKRIKQIQNIDYDILEKIKLNIPKIDVTALQKALLEITIFIINLLQFMILNLYQNYKILLPN